MKEKKDPVILEDFFSFSFSPFFSTVTHGHDGSYLRIQIKNNVGRTGVVLPNPRTNADRRVSSP